jgi:hypothetical protein
MIKDSDYVCHPFTIDYDEAVYHLGYVMRAMQEDFPGWFAYDYSPYPGDCAVASYNRYMIRAAARAL